MTQNLTNLFNKLKLNSKSGLLYESLTELSSEYKTFENNKYYKKIKFNCSDIMFISTKQAHLFKYLNKYVNKEINQANGCKKPDECYINEDKKQLFIIEKKFQRVNGSTCEKIQTPDFKLWQYGRTFPQFKVIYILFIRLV